MNHVAPTHAGRRIVSLLALVAMLLATIGLAGPADARNQKEKGPQVETWLTLLHNNDGESALIPTEVDGELFGGVANFASVVDDLRDDRLGTGRHRGVREATLLVSSGDNYLAGAQFQASLDKGIPFYDAMAMDLIGYDAIAIGNHEFDFGPEVLADFIGSFRHRAPFVTANLDFSAEPSLQRLVDRHRIADSIVVKDGGERFGIVGATTEMLPVISSPRDVVVEDVLDAVQAEVDSLQSHGVDKIILISHLQSILEDQDLATRLEGVDIMVAGGGDELLANDDDLLVPGDEAAVFGPYPMIAIDAEGREVPLVTTSGGYRYVGRLLVGFDDDGNVLTIDDRSGPIRVTSGSLPDAVRPDRKIQRRVVDPVQDYVASLATTVVARTEVPLNSARGVVDADTAPPTSVLSPGERVSETNLGNLAADALLWQAAELAPSFGTPVPDIAFQNGGGIRQPDELLFPTATTSAPQDVSRLDVANQFPFPNFVAVLPDVPLAQVKVVLENAVSRVEFVDGRFAHVSGLEFHWDSTLPANVGRVTDITVGGTPVLADGIWLVDPVSTTVNVATIDFLARGQDGYDFAGAPFEVLGVTYDQAVTNYITGPLSGVIAEADYPNVTGTRIVQDG